MMVVIQGGVDKRIFTIKVVIWIGRFEGKMMQQINKIKILYLLE